MVGELRLVLDCDTRQVMELKNPKIVCTDSSLIAISSDDVLNFSGLYVYNFADSTWQRLVFPDLYNKLYMVSILMMGRYIVIHGRLRNDTREETPNYQTYKGDVTEGTICLHLIGTLELSVQPKIHRTIFDGTNYLYAVTVIENTSNQSYNILVHRLDMVSNWTVVYDNVFLCALPDIYVLENYLRTENMFIYHSVLYVFPFNQRDNSVDFSTLIGFDLRRVDTSGKKILLSADGSRFPNSHLYHCRFSALAQCPVEPRYVYRVVGTAGQNPLWNVWRLDLAEMRWCQPQGNVFGRAHLDQLTAAITPSGWLYVIRSDISARRENVLEPVFQAHDLFRATVRVRPLQDLCLAAATGYLAAVDPDWPRARHVSDVVQWILQRDQQPPPQNQHPARPREGRHVG